jgi:hypothetical protein
MVKKNESGMDRLKAMPLWQWGLLVIVGALVGSALQAHFAPVAPNPAAARGAALGRVVAALLFIFGGVVMIVVHFARRGR